MVMVHNKAWLSDNCIKFCYNYDHIIYNNNVNNFIIVNHFCDSSKDSSCMSMCIICILISPLFKCLF